MFREKNDRLDQLKKTQALHCFRVQPWLSSTGARTSEGKKRVTQNLPNQRLVSDEVVKQLSKLELLIQKIKKAEEKARQKQLKALQKLEKLAKIEVKNNDIN